ncbi:hypothetical protein D3C72_2017220 [compost metagenome]
MPSKSTTRPLSEKLFAYMSRKPYRRYTPNEFTKLFKVSTREAVGALAILCDEGRLLSEPMPPKGWVYYVNSKTPQHRYTPPWRDLNGWEAGLRSHMALCALTRPK